LSLDGTSQRTIDLFSPHGGSVLISDIIIGEKRREVKSDYVQKLADSIKQVGLINPITIAPDNRLIAGYHRLQAFIQLGETRIPAVILNLSELEARLAEIDENLIRNEGSALERGEWLLERKSIYEELFPETKVGGLPGAPGGGKQAKTADSATFAEDTANKTGQSRRVIEENIQIARDISPEVKDKIRDTELADRKTDLLLLSRLNPEKQKEISDSVVSGEFKDVKTAINAIKLREAKKEAEEAAIKTDVELSIHHGDCIDWLKSLPEDADLLITDPPYATDVENIEEFANSWLPVALNRVKSTGRAYVCIGAYPDELKAYLNIDSGHLELCQVLVWTYRNTLGPSPKDQYKLNWQAILYYKGIDAPELNCPIMTEQFSVQDINAPDNRYGTYERWHAWQKPDELAERLIRHSTKEGDVVIDPFAGTGTFILAATKLNRVAFGCDKDSEMIQIAHSRRGVLSEC